MWQHYKNMSRNEKHQLHGRLFIERKGGTEVASTYSVKLYYIKKKYLKQI